MSGAISEPLDKLFLRIFSVGVGVGDLGVASVAGINAGIRVLLSQFQSLDSLELSSPRAIAVLISEAGGGHPRAIQTSAVRVPEGWRIDGEKIWTTFGPLAESFVLLASTGRDGDRNRLGVFWIADAKTQGIECLPIEHMPVIPHIPHSRTILRDVRLPDTALLNDGVNGYESVVRAFRFYEDFAVSAATLGAAVAIGRSVGLPHEEFIPSIAACCAAAIQLGRLPKTGVHESAEAQLWLEALLAGCRGGAERLNEHLQTIAKPHPEAAERFVRDKALTNIAARARRQRTKKALASFAGL